VDNGRNVFATLAAGATNMGHTPIPRRYRRRVHAPAGRAHEMTFNPGAKLDPDQVTDVRGRSYGGGRGLAVGGGGIGLVIAIVYLLLGGDPGALVTQDPGGAVTGPNSSAIAGCKSGADANARADCRIVGFVNSIQAYWTEAYKAGGGTYRAAPTVLFSGGVNTGCGSATSASGPFYCPPDESIYIDLDFFNALQERFGAEGGPLAEAYVVAHEYGHHIQNLEGTLQPGGDTGAESRAVRTELQADCLAGVWVNHAASTGFLRPPTKEQIGQALDAAAAVGDDRIQAQTEGQVNPEAWTHGSAAQRQEWFTTGFESGSAGSCDTFSGEI
jgi:predicted metalloprotease